MDELQKLLETARRAAAAGVPAAKIDEAVASRTGGKITSVAALEQALQPDAIQGHAPSLASDMGRMVAQGATFGFGDELAGLGAALVPGGQSYDQAVTESRGRLARVRREHPVASVAAEALGGMWLPVGEGANVGRAVLGATGSRVIAGLAGGAAGGAVGGLLQGAGDAEGGVGNRLKGAAVGTVIGGVTGGALGAAGGTVGRAIDHIGGFEGEAGDHARMVLRERLREAGIHNPTELLERMKDLPEGSVVADLSPALGREARAAVNRASSLIDEGGPVRAIERRNSERGARMADELRSTSGLPHENYAASLRAAGEGVEAVRHQWYQPLENLYPRVNGKNVRSVLRSPGVREAAGRISPDIASGKRAPTFRELQDLMMELRDDMTAARKAGRPNASAKTAASYQTLVDAMEKDIPEFGPAQAAYHVAIKRQEAHEVGRKLFGKPASDIAATFQRYPGEAADALRQGLLDRYETALRKRTTGGAVAAGLMNAGPETVDVLRHLVSSDEGLQRLLAGTEREARWARTWAALSGNSTTAAQVTDLITQIPTSKANLVGKLVSSIFSLNDRERRAAAEMIGKVLLTDGEDAARRLTRDLALKRGIAAPAGAAIGSALSTSATKPEGLLQ